MITFLLIRISQIKCHLLPEWFQFSRWTHIFRSSFSVRCREGNKTYGIGERFHKDDCSERCICLEVKSEGLPFCAKLCESEKTKKTCSTGYKKNVTKDFFPGSHCFCNQATCVQGMFSFTINFIQKWKKLLTEIVNFWKKKP